MAKKWMFFLDFDGTISREDVCFNMVKKFAREGWEAINRLWEEGQLSTAECAELTLELLEAGPEELEAFFKNTEIDVSFITFVNWTKGAGYPLYILSDGYDNYIKEVLHKYQLKIPYYANHLVYERGWGIKCLHTDKECKRCGVCKTELIRELLQPGYQAIYIGDGYSDICPAECCDMVFAKDQLARLCREKEIPFYHYRDFTDIQIILQNLLTNNNNTWKGIQNDQ
ncbi:MAG: MtnX-like HAD-IB family phosphatase [Syntrophomonas sp.]|nr:MtnX-like HAD-IB family phosphatase [Syntrophomonas sp.]